MSLSKFNKDVNNHQSLPDKPTLTAEELKSLWDKAAFEIKEYLNQVLTEEIDSENSKFQTEINNNNSKISENTMAINNMLNRVYPIGSIYMSVNNTNPSTIFGGTWVAWGAGRVPVGVSSETEFNSVEKTGGAKTHTLTINQMPSHGHSVSIPSSGGCTTSSSGQHSHSGRYVNTVPSNGGTNGARTYNHSGDLATITSSDGAHTHTVPNHTHTVNQSNAGGGQAHNNLQPYITCYMWKRTA